MSEKRRVKLPGRYGEKRWYVVQFSLDDEYSDPVSLEDIEDETGKTGTEGNFDVGDNVSASWRDGQSYEGVVVFESEDKEKCLKFLEKKRKPVKRKSADTKNTKKDADQLTKKKKEANEEKKKLETQRQKTAVKNAEELFKLSMDNVNVGTCDNSTVEACSKPPTNNQAPSSHTCNITVTQPSDNIANILAVPLPPLPNHLPRNSYSLTSASNSNTFSVSSNNTMPSSTYSMPSPFNVNNMYSSNNSMPSPFNVNNMYSSNNSMPSPFSVNNTMSSNNNNSMPSPLGVYNTMHSSNNSMPSPIGVNNTMHSSNNSMPSPIGVNNTMHSSNNSMPSPIGVNNSMPSPFGVYNTMPSSNYSMPSPFVGNNTMSASMPSMPSSNMSMPSPSSVNNTVPSATNMDNVNNTLLSPSNPLTEFSNLTNQNCNPDEHQQTVGCTECILKDAQIDSLRSFNEKLESDIVFWKDEATRLRTRLGHDTEPEHVNDGKSVLFDSSDHYTPSRGTRVHKCNYKIIEDFNYCTMPAGYVPLVEGHAVLVPVAWLTDVQGAYKGKTKPCALKLMFNGFFQPKEVIGKTGAELAETLVGQAIKAYALKNFAMDGKAVIAAFNSKIGTMIRAHKKLLS